MVNLPERYDYKLQVLPRGSTHAGPILNSCNRPWKIVSIDSESSCLLCSCDGWLPVPVGKITDFDRLEQVWDNPIAHAIQASITEKKYTWCAVEHCGILNQSYSEPRYQLNFGIDDSCNLHCPSCRREPIMYSSGPVFEQKLAAVKHTVELLNKFEERIHILLASSGDPLASHIYRPLLHSYQGKPTQTFTLFTNGLLIKKQLDKTAIQKQITLYMISVDAGSADVYHDVRRGGSWSVLIENFEYLKEHRGRAAVLLSFVVQRNNYRDIQNFADMCVRFGFSGSFTQLDDWGTWNQSPSPTPDVWEIKNGTYGSNNVLDPTHPEHEECLDMLLQVRDQNLPGINFTPMVQKTLNEQK